MQSNVNGPKLDPVPVTVRPNILLEDEETNVESIVKKSLNEVWNQNSEEIKKISKDQMTLKIDVLTPYSTSPIKTVVTNVSPAPLASIVNPIIDSCVKNTVKKVVVYTIDKYFDNAKLIDNAFEQASQSTRSCFQYMYDYISFPKESKEPENK
ncbi:MAG: hypothetical protein Q8K60_04720 [Parachlamydiaceae bacterium]|nr:hypothetical protein [Parachlamydiaceae bacterium]